MEPPQFPDARIYAALLESLYDGICFVDTEGKITFWNHGAERITGRLSRQVLGIIMGSDLIQHINASGVLLIDMECPLIATLNDGAAREEELYIRHAEGFPIPVLIKTFPIYSKTKHLIGAAETFSDNPTLMRERRREESLEQTTAYDTLTLVGNRKHLENKIRAALLGSKYSGLPFGILFIDIDHFKAFNDTYGHNTGDRVLRAVANTLRYNLRDSDTCGRWGGEEFLAIIFGMDGKALEVLAEKLRLLVTQAVVDADKNVPNVTISIGATLAKPDDTMETLVHRADTLMYQSKADGRNRTSFG